MTSKKHFTAVEARKIGEALGIDWSEFDIEQYRMGLDVELEHGKVDRHTNVTDDDPIMTGKIALAHLTSFRTTIPGWRRWRGKLKGSCKNWLTAAGFPVSRAILYIQGYASYHHIARPCGLHTTFSREYRLMLLPR